MDDRVDNFFKSSNQRKKRKAAEFNELRDAQAAARAKRVEEKAAFNATPEGQQAMKISRKKLVTLLAVGAALGGLP